MARTDLSRMSWNSYVSALGDCDAGPLARTGVMIFPLDEGFAQRLATALLDLEPRLRRIRNYRALPLLREALRRHLAVKKSAA